MLGRSPLLRGIEMKLAPILILVLLSAHPAAGDDRPLFGPGIKPPWEGTPVVFDHDQAEQLWRTLAYGYFGERPIVEGDGGIRLEAPSRAEDDAMVPVSISTVLKEPVKRIYLVVDVNPIPMGGVFTVSENRSIETISTRVRVNGFTYVRAVAETVSGKLYMDKRMVKSRGAACAAPPITDPEQAKANLGKMRFKQMSARGGDELDAILLHINHPNATGLQKDQVSLLYIPEHYVKEILVTFNDELILKAETSYTISENPTFRFNFMPQEEGELKAQMTDTKGNVFSMTSQIKPTTR